MITEPGVYTMPDAEYHADPVAGGSLSSSGARLLLPPNCPAKFEYYLTNPRPPKAVFDFGHAAHRFLLGVGSDIVSVDAADWSTKAAKAERAEAYDAGRVPLLTADYDHALAMAAAVRNHPKAGGLFNRSNGIPEQSLFYTDPRTGIWLRARLDWMTTLTSGRCLIVDYKTTPRADLDSIRKSISNYGYHQQAPWYCDAVTALGLGDNPGFMLVVQEKTPPYLVTIVEIHPESIAWGRADNRRAIDTYIDCKEAGVWPGYADDFEMLNLPRWRLRQYEDALEAGTYDYVETS